MAIIRKRYFSTYSNFVNAITTNSSIEIMDEYSHLPERVPYAGFSTELPAGIPASIAGYNLTSFYSLISSSGTYNIPPNSGSAGNPLSSGDARYMIRHTERRILEWVPVVDVGFFSAPNSGIPLIDVYLQPCWTKGYETAGTVGVAGSGESGYKEYIGTVFANNYNFLNTDTTSKYRTWFNNNILPPVKNINNFGLRIINRTNISANVYIKLYPIMMEIVDE